MFRSRLTFTGQSYVVQKNLNCNTYKFVIRILFRGIPELYNISFGNRR